MGNRFSLYIMAACTLDVWTITPLVSKGRFLQYASHLGGKTFHISIGDVLALLVLKVLGGTLGLSKTIKPQKNSSWL
ncbi:MAG: hypothetical protein IKJ95_04800 [Bacteroidaceae bacterium]|nr:hypothetical protein [Bacteroidaceae bacterium]